LFADDPAMFASARRAALALARRADHAAGRTLTRLRVLVDARTPMNLAVLAPVWRALLEDERLDVRFTGTGRADLAAAFTTSAVGARVMPRSAAARRRWDLYMNADPWEPARLWRVRHRVNFFHGVAGKYDLECPTGLPLDFERYDRVAFPNKARLERYVDAGIVHPDRAVLVGFPKLDSLVNARISPSEAAATLGLPTDRKTIVYAPTFSPHGSLQHHGEAIVRTVMDAGYNVIVKLHDRSLDADPRYSGGRDWRARFAPLSNIPGFLFATNEDSTMYLLAADAMITDHSTIGFEFCALDRPLIVFDVPDLLVAARVDAGRAHLLRSAADVVATVEQVAAAVRGALERPQRLSPARAAAVKEVFHDPGRATSRALALCYHLLECPAQGADQRLHAAAGQG
jgi:hypothetical protein